MTRTRVKVCGVTSPEDARMLEAAGVDAIGLNFAPRSKRRVDVARAEEIVAACGPLLLTVGVFVDAELDEVVGLAERLRLAAVQLHGSEGTAYAARLAAAVKVIRAVPWTAAPTPDSVRHGPVDAWLLDGAVPGSGTPFGWVEAAAWRGHARLVLAGGLTPDNVAAAIAALRPYAVDVATGVEAAPGVKDEALVRAFLAGVQAADERGDESPVPTQS